ncbi:MAG: hypothetical protein ACEPOW_09855 [Bacteroidales bacterium]
MVFFTISCSKEKGGSIPDPDGRNVSVSNLKKEDKPDKGNFFNRLCKKVVIFFECLILDDLAGQNGKLCPGGINEDGSFFYVCIPFDRGPYNCRVGEDPHLACCLNKLNNNLPIIGSKKLYNFIQGKNIDGEILTKDEFGSYLYDSDMEVFAKIFSLEFIEEMVNNYDVQIYLKLKGDLKQSGLNKFSIYFKVEEGLETQSGFLELRTSVIFN